MEHVIHPFPPVWDKNCRILILGSFPSVKSRETGYFYGHPQNRFWRLLAALCGEATPQTVEQKKDRLYDGLESLTDYAAIFPKARLKHEWIKAGWHEFICEDFHFAYERTFDSQGEDLIIVHDAIHSLLYH